MLSPKFVCAVALLLSSPAAAEQSREVARLYRLFKQSDESYLSRNPLESLFRGDQGSGKFGDYLSDRYFADERRAAERDLRALAAIDRQALSPDARVAYDSFAWQRCSDLEGLQAPVLRVSRAQPIEQVKGLHVLMAQISRTGSVTRFDTAADYDRNLQRLSGYAAYLQAVRVALQNGLRHHLTEPEIVAAHVAEQLDEVLDAGVERGPFYEPVTRMPPSMSRADQRRIKADYAALIRGRLLPAYRSLSTFLHRQYLPKARRQPGLSAVPGGHRLYLHLVREFTTTDMRPEQIHALGLAEVARIEAAMEGVKQKVAFKGTLAEFAEAMRTDRRFAPKSADELADTYGAIQAKVEAQLPQHFGRLPKAKLIAVPLAGLGAATAPNASYSQGPPDGSRPGVFHFNVSDLPSRRTFYTESLFLHEGEPGHHLQDNLAQENSGLPDFLRFDGTIAFGEGWALYAESLGPEFGLYRDPYQLYGRYTNELFRAARLVVDTGIHHDGWSRQQAIDYLLQHTALSRTMIEQEVDRYIAYPGQALAYKVGELRFLALRRRAEQALGSRFDERAFHDVVLEDGRVPLQVLEAKVDRWIADQRGQ